MQNAIRLLDIADQHELNNLIAHIQKHGCLPSDCIILKYRTETAIETLTRLEDEAYCAMFL